MLPSKPHLEFHRIDMHSGWETPPGYPPGIEQKILAGALDEERKTGSRTRLLRFAPGVYTSAPFVHEYWEEVYLVSGDLTVGNDAGGQGGESFAAGTSSFARRGSTRFPARTFRSRSSPSPRRGRSGLWTTRWAAPRTRPISPRRSER